MQLDLFPIDESENAYDLRKRIWMLEEENRQLKITVSKSDRCLFAQVSEIRKMYQELKEENAQLRFKIGVPEVELSKYELFAGERCG